MERDGLGRLLEAVNAGDEGAFESVVCLVYGELRRMAGSLMRGRTKGNTLQPTALVHEAYLRLVQGDTPWQSRAHFFGAAARAMRQVLEEHARRKSARKRAGGGPGDGRRPGGPLRGATDGPLRPGRSLAALARVDERFTRVMELRYFGGFRLEEIADLTGRSLATVKRDWTYARAWLNDYMGSRDPRPPRPDARG